MGEFVEARLILETELAGLCAERITQKELKQMEAMVDRMKQAIHDNGDEFWKLDLSFHLSMGIAAKNDVLSNILKGVREQMMDLISKSLLLREGMEQAVIQHTKVLEAIRQHNPTKAREAMRNHLQSFQRGYKVLFEQNQLNGQD